MAIQFDCPVCTTTIKVPDSASGKKGKCPRCETVMRVPTIEVPATAAGPSAAPEPAPPAEAPATDAPAADAPGRPGWMKGGNGEPASPPPDDPSGFVEAAPDGPPDFSQFDDGPAAEPLIQTGSATPAAAPPPVEEEIPADFPVINRRRRRRPANGDSDGGEPAGEPAAAGEAPSGKPGPAGRRVRRKRKKKGKLPTWALPVGGVVLLGALFAGFQWFNIPNLEGSLEGEAYGYLVLPPKTLDATSAGMKMGEFETFAEALERQTLYIYGPRMRTDIRGRNGGLEIRVREGETTRFVKVLKNDPELKRFAQERKDSLQSARDESLGRTARGFAKFVKKNGPNVTDPDYLLEIRDNLALHSLTLSLGAHLAALYKGTKYPCCYEDVDAVYFLLPKSAQEFSVTGREVNGSTLFYGTYHVEGVKEIPGEKPADYVDPWDPTGEDRGSGDPGSTDEGGGLSEIFGGDSGKNGDDDAMKKGEMKGEMKKGEMMEKP